MRCTVPLPVPSLAQRVIALRALGLASSTARLLQGRELQFHFSISPSSVGRFYKCMLRLRPDSRAPDMLVLAPNLLALAGKDPIPHVYQHPGPGVKLCLWWPKQREWVPQLKLTQTLIPWTAEWLWYFEDWLTTRDWAGGGMHPEPRRKRQSPRANPAASTSL